MAFAASWSPSLPLTMCLTQLISSTKVRIEALKNDNPHRPIVLVGCGAGAAIAAQVSKSSLLIEFKKIYYE